MRGLRCTRPQVVPPAAYGAARGRGSGCPLQLPGSSGALLPACLLPACFSHRRAGPGGRGGCPTIWFGGLAYSHAAACNAHANRATSTSRGDACGSTYYSAPTGAVACDLLNTALCSAACVCATRNLASTQPKRAGPQHTQPRGRHRAAAASLRRQGPPIAAARPAGRLASAPTEGSGAGCWPRPPWCPTPAAPGCSRPCAGPPGGG